MHTRPDPDPEAAKKPALHRHKALAPSPVISASEEGHEVCQHAFADALHVVELSVHVQPFLSDVGFEPVTQVSGQFASTGVALVMPVRSAARYVWPEQGVQTMSAFEIAHLAK